MRKIILSIVLLLSISLLLLVGSHVAPIKNTSALGDPLITFTISGIDDGSSSATIITIDGNQSKLPVSFNWLEGEAHSVTASNVASDVTDKQYRFDSWTNWEGQTEYSGTYIVPPSDTIVTANYVTQYKVTFDASNNIKADSTDNIITVGGIGETASNLPFTTGWIDSGTSLSWAYSSNVASAESPAGTRYRWSSSSGIDPPGISGSLAVTAPETITGIYTAQHQLSVNGGDSVTYGTASPTSDNWYNAGMSTTVSSNGVWSRSGGSGQRVASWNLDGMNNIAFSSTGVVTTLPISMTTHHTVDFNALTQYQVNLDSRATAALSSITPPTIPFDYYWYDSGVSVSITLNGVYGRNGGSGSRITGYVLNGGDDNPESTTGTFNAFSGIMYGSVSVTVSTVTQHLLTVSGGNDIIYTTASSIDGDTGWYDSGSSTTISSNWVWNSIAEKSRTAITNYAVDGANRNPPRSNASILSTYLIMMSTAHTVSFTSTTQYYLTNQFVQNSLNSITYSPTSDGWYDSETTVRVSLNNIWNEMTNQSRQNLIKYFNGSIMTSIPRIGTGVTAYTVRMSTYRTINDTSTTQYYLKVNGGNTTTFSTVSPTSDQWYDVDSSTTVSSKWVWSITPKQSRTIATNWQLDGIPQNPTQQLSGTLTTSNIIMNTYHTINIISTIQYYLTVTGGNNITYGKNSQTGDNWYDAGSSTTISTNWVWNILANQSRTANVNWQLDTTNQSISRLGTGILTTSSISMSTFHTVNFVPTIQYYLATTGGNGVSTPGSQTNDSWFDAGTSGTVTSSYVWNNMTGKSRSNLYAWNLDGTSRTLVTRSNKGTFTTSRITMINHHTVNLETLTQYYLNVTGGDNISFGTVSPTGDNWYDSGQTTTISSNGVWNAIGEQSKTVITNWQLDGSNQNLTIQGTGTITTPIISLSTYHEVVFSSITQYYLTVTSVKGTVSGSGWYNRETHVSVSVISPVTESTGTQYVCTGCTGTGSAPVYSSATTVDFTITQPSTITWNWRTSTGAAFGIEYVLGIILFIVAASFLIYQFIRTGSKNEISHLFK
ncbi:MAG: hypothetical protein QG670_427 [Thermoproteota archaeon]|nr:hypothetical protein [Thermoproteota archaeon]